MAKGSTDNVIDLVGRSIPIRHNGELLIATGKSRYETHWKNKTMLWSMLLARLSDSLKTPETHAEFMRMPKDQQDRIKDIGGFVGGHLTEGRRKSGSVASRSLLTLDLDFPPPDLWNELMDNLELDCALAIYSTHKHTEKAPRLRLIIPLDRAVSPDEYEAISRKIAEKIGIDYFDDSTFQPARLMYWPSHSADVEPYFKYYDAPWLRASDVLAEYPDWQDTSYWPESSRMTGARKKMADKQGDPLEKKGIVGAFCRAYTVTAAIDKFLSDVYAPTASADRYTYMAGSSASGLVIYDGDLFAFSNHSTDPACGQLCNAFDLVRIHKFGDLDEGKEDKAGKARPSFKAMTEFASEDPEVRSLLSREAAEKAASDFAPIKEKEDWRQRLRRNDGKVIPDAVNAELILSYDEHLQGIRFNEMSRRIEADGMPWNRPGGPWRDADDAQLYQWIAKTHAVQFPDTRFSKALTAVADRRRFNPVKEYLDSLPAWDGVERADSLLIDYLGADDNIFTREATRKTLTAALARIYTPGTKFDTVLVLQGPQGIGKSMLFSLLGGDWFSDSLSVGDMKDKTGAERLQGYWIVEISEMAGMRKAEVEVVKSFVARRDDVYRAAYGRNTESHKRRCVIIGTTNEETGFLRDITGNRRFWPVKVTGQSERHPWDLTPVDVDQIWAEVKIGYELGEDLLLSRDAEKLAVEAQRESMELDERQGIVEEYLDKLLPENWDSLGWDERMMFLDGDQEGTVRRTTVTNIEIWVEALKHKASDMEPKDARAITAMMARIPGWKKTGSYTRGIYGKQRLYQKQ